MDRTLSRRALVRRAAAGSLALSVAGCSQNDSAYRDALMEQTHPLGPDPSLADLVRCATLAANGHNTQPWLFRASDGSVAILPDFSRRTPVVDPDDHHLYASLGCAAENMHLAARARGMTGAVSFKSTEEGRIDVDLGPAATDETDLFAAIPARQCTRAAYDGMPVATDIIARLSWAANQYGVDAEIITDERRMEDILALVIEGNSHQIDDPAFVQELKDWLRFNPNAAAAWRDGLYSACSGNPTVPDWLGPITFDLFFTKGAENDKYAEHVRSSAGIVVFVAKSDDPEGWMNAGRAYERFALQTTADGLKHAFINQAVEVPEMRRNLQTLLSLGDRRPNLVVRFGHGPTLPKSLRRPVQDVMV